MPQRTFGRCPVGVDPRGDGGGFPFWDRSSPVWVTRSA